MAFTLCLRVIATRGGEERSYSFSTHELNGKLLVGSQKSSYYIPHVRTERRGELVYTRKKSGGDSSGDSSGGCNLSLFLGGSEQYLDGFLSRAYFYIEAPDSTTGVAADESGEAAAPDEEFHEAQEELYVCFSSKVIDEIKVVNEKLEEKGVCVWSLLHIALALALTLSFVAHHLTGSVKDTYKDYIMLSFVGSPTVKEVYEVLFKDWEEGKEFRSQAFKTPSKKRKLEEEQVVVITPYDG